MERETRVLLVAGVLLLAATAGWSRLHPSGDAPVDRTLAARIARPGTPSVAILFTPQDCGTLIESLRIWNAPSAAGRLAVRGYLQTPRGRSDELRKVVRGAVLRFPVESVDAARASEFRDAIGYRGESVIVLTDAAGRIRFTIPLDSVSSPGARAHVVELAESLRPR